MWHAEQRRIVFGSLLLGLVCTASAVLAQDVSPLKAHHVWLPMTGVTGKQMDDARSAGYDTVMLKIHPLVSADNTIDFTATDQLVQQATDKGFKVLLPILGWVGLGEGRFWDVEQDGQTIPNQLDPFWPAAMQQVEWYYAQVIAHYASNACVVGFAPTWGIYGEAGFTSQRAGRSPQALARFNEWRAQRDLPTLDKLPTALSGPNTEFNRFVQFRYQYVEQQFDALVKRLKQAAGTRPVGMWQELYPVMGYLWTMVEVPAADFALYESCFPFQTTHHPEKTLAETMGFRYRCNSASDYRDYYLPLIARKRGEGQRFMGCQLSNDYAKKYGWTLEKAEKIGFDRWEDEFSPDLKKLLDEPLETPERDVLLIFPTYAAAALTRATVHSADTQIMDTTLRMYGCQMSRYGSPRLDKMALADMDRFKLIIVPESAFLLRATYAKLKRTKAKVLFTGEFARALDGEQIPFGAAREMDGTQTEYFQRPAGTVAVAAEHPLTSGLPRMLAEQPVRLDKDEAFRCAAAEVLLTCGNEPLLTVRGGRMIFVHGHLWAAASFKPQRVPPKLGGSTDASANANDGWGPYDSANPQNAFASAVMKNILDFAGVDYRVPNPKPRTLTPYLADHIEQISISANIVYNNTAQAQSITVRTPYAPKNFSSRLLNGRYETSVTVPAFSYVALQPK